MNQRPLRPYSLALVAILAACGGSSPTGLADKPGGDRTAVPSASGGPNLADGTSLSFTVAEPNLGEVQHSTSNGFNWHAEIVCVDVSGDRAWFAARIDRSDAGYEPGTWMLYAVDDNGSSSRPPFDQVCWQPTDDSERVEEFCSGENRFVGNCSDVTGGNLWVKW